MARTARGHGVRGVCGVTLKTRHMPGASGRYVSSHAATLRCMTGHAVYTRVSTMIEPRTEGLKSRERFESAGLRVCVTNRTYRARRVVELQPMTARARKVIDLAGKAETCRVVVATVTDEAREPCMVFVAVPEPGIIDRLFRFGEGGLDRRAGFVCCRGHLGQ